MLSTVYIACAAFGGTILAIQLLMSLFGFGMDGDLDAGTDANGDAGGIYDHGSPMGLFFRVISLRTLIAGCTFFGLGGMTGLSGGLGDLGSLLLAITLGILAILGVYYLYYSLSFLKSDGNLNRETLPGATGSVYLKIPGAKSGRGRVLINQQDRTVEYEALTSGEEIPAGTPVVVSKIISEQVVEVRKADS